MASQGNSAANLAIRSAQDTPTGNEDSRPDDASLPGAAAGDDEGVVDEPELNRRRREVVDFWYSEGHGDPDLLPLEWAQKENIEGRITLAGATLDPSNWTGPGTLATMFVKACYQKSGQRLKQLREDKPAAARSINFVERLGRRFTMEFARHEAADAQLSSDAHSTAARLRSIVMECEMDIKWRIEDGHGDLSEQGKTDYMRRLLDTLLSTLSRASQTTGLPSAAASFSTPAHSPTSPPEHTLFGTLFVDYEGDEFILPLLETIYNYTDGLDVKPKSIGDVSRTLEHLQQSNACQAYLTRFRRIFPSLTD